MKGEVKEEFVRHLSRFGYFQQMDEGDIHTENLEERELEKGKIDRGIWEYTKKQR
ncbi:putative peptidoglycan binding domain-containing protein [Saccharococcus thermophilus]|uniref:Putative peptidoglycan binding domain-containing protein n=1 Tax=Saccharococcus thermophilus TaxID=29396 RepID=A0A846MIM6_9BACL|nr:hypothetical protein [Saccharococcus thermophilus]